MARMRGRPTKFTEETRNYILDGVAKGMAYSHAARYGGVAYTTMREWLIRGKREYDRQNPPEGEEVQPLLDDDDNPMDELIHAEAYALEDEYREFYEHFEGQKMLAVHQHLTVINESAEKDPNWAAFLLKMSYPEEYGQQARSRIEVTGPGGGPLEMRHSGELELDISTAKEVFDILASSGYLELAAVGILKAGTNPPDDEVHPNSANAETKSLPAPRL